MTTKMIRVKIPKYRISSTGAVGKVGTTMKVVRVKIR